MIYLYAITERDAAAPDGRGLEDEPIELLKGSELAAVYSTCSASRFSPDPEALWRHDEVVERAMSAGPALPARFGSTFADPEALALALDRDAPRLRQQLERVRGCVELAVRVGRQSGAETRSGDGREYVQGLLADARARRAAIEVALAPLAKLAVCTRIREHGGESSVITASYLVRAHEVERFADEVRLLQRQNPELSLSCTGPWPPYSFTSSEQEAA